MMDDVQKNRNFFRVLMANGFTLVELCVSVGIVSVVILAWAEVNLISQRTAQSNAAADEFNSNINLLIGLVNTITQNPGVPNQNGCTSTFGGMSISGVTSLPIISSAQAALPPPSPVAAFNVRQLGKGGVNTTFNTVGDDIDPAKLGLSLKLPATPNGMAAEL